MSSRKTGNKYVTTANVRKIIAELLEEEKNAEFHKKFNGMSEDIHNIIVSKSSNQILSLLQRKRETNPHNVAITTLRERFALLLNAFFQVVRELYATTQKGRWIQVLHMRTPDNGKYKYVYDIYCISANEFGGLRVVLSRREFGQNELAIGFKAKRLYIIKAKTAKDQKDIFTTFQKHTLYNSKYTSDFMRVLEADISRNDIPYEALLEMKPLYLTSGYMVDIIRRLEVDYKETDDIQSFMQRMQQTRDTFLQGRPEDELESNKRHMMQFEKTIKSFENLLKVCDMVQVGGEKNQFKRTQEKVNILGRERSVFVNAQRKKYITYKRAYVSLTTARTMSA